MSDTQIKSVALFFFFAFFDELKALELTSRTVKLVRKNLRDGSLDTNALIVKFAQKVLAKESRKHEPSPPPQDLTIFQIPETMHLGHLHALRKRATLEEFSSLVWTRVLGLSEEAVALGLDSSIGTIRHRNSNALKTLGRSIPPEAVP